MLSLTASAVSSTKGSKIGHVRISYAVGFSPYAPGFFFADGFCPYALPHPRTRPGGGGEDGAAEAKARFGCA